VSRVLKIWLLGMTSVVNSKLLNQDVRPYIHNSIRGISSNAL
jgi:hypothetical protein